jgi:hypothetical protein
MSTSVYLGQLDELAALTNGRTPTRVRAAASGGADAGEGADTPGLGQRHAQPPVVREPHLARQLLQRQIPPVWQRALRRRRRGRVDRGPQLLLQPPPPLLRVLEVHGRGRATGGVVGPASAGGVAPPVLDRLVEQRDEALHLRIAACEAEGVGGKWLRLVLVLVSVGGVRFGRGRPFYATPLSSVS